MLEAQIPTSKTSLREGVFQLFDQAHGVLNFFFVERKSSCMGGGVENSIGAGKDVVDEFDFSDSADMFGGGQIAEALAICL